MASTIVTKNSSTASAVPLTGDLTQGELAVNVTDKKLYTKDSGGTVVKLVGGLGNQEANAVAITGGSVNGTTIGATTASTGAFTTLSASSTTTLSGGTANGVAYLNGSKVVTTGSALTFDGSKFLISSSGEQLKLLSSGDFSTTGLGYLRFYDSNGARGYLGYGGTADTLSLSSGLSNYLNFATITAASWNINGSEQMRLTSTGLGIGTSSPATRLSVDNTRSDTAGTGWFTYTNAAVTSGKRGMRVDTNNVYWFDYYNGSSWSAQMGLDSSGNLLVGTTSQISVAGANGAHCFSTATAANWASVFQQTNANPLGVAIRYATDSNNTSNEFFYCVGNATLRASIRSNGGLANYSANNVNLSDERLKKDFQAAPSYYDRWQQIDFVTFLYKDQTDDERNLGVKAGQLESVCPELIDNSGFGKAPEGEAPYKAVYQTDFQYATAVALQEAIKKIEQLTERITALEGK